MSTLALPAPGRPAVWAAGWLTASLVCLLGLVLLAGGPPCATSTSSGSVAGQLPAAGGLLAPELREAINRLSARFHVDPHVIGALAMRETAGGTAVRCSGSGACGAMQLMPSFWQANQCDGDGDARLDINNISDNVCASIHGLIHDKRTLFERQMTRGEIATMARSYCGSCTDANCGGSVDGGYCEGVVRNFERLGGTFGHGPTSGVLITAAATLTGSLGGAQCAAAQNPPAGGSGRWKVAPGAFSAQVPIDALLSAFLDRVASYTSRAPVLTTGSAGHGLYTTNGAVSEHSVGRAGDFGSGANAFPIASVGPGSPLSFGDELASAALIAAGLAPPEAQAQERRGGITNVIFDLDAQRVRVQVIWRSNNRALGGDHTDHVHIGVKALGPATGQPPQVQHLGP